MGTDYSRYFSEVLPGLFLGRFPRFTWGRFQGFFQGGSTAFSEAVPETFSGLLFSTLLW